MKCFSKLRIPLRAKLFVEWNFKNDVRVSDISDITPDPRKIYTNQVRSLGVPTGISQVLEWALALCVGRALQNPLWN